MIYLIWRTRISDKITKGVETLDQSKSFRSIPWARLGVEGAIIIASILAAFSIDAWWAARSAKAQERILLVSLAADFAEAEQELSRIKSRHVTLAGSGEMLITYGESGNIPVDDRDEIDLAVSNHFDRAVFEPPMGTVDSIVGSGNINLLSNDQLIAELTRWSAVVAKLKRVEIDARNNFYERFYPYLASRLDLEDLDKGFADFVDFPWEQEPTDVYKLLSDQEFLNILYMHWVLSRNTIISIERVEESLARIRTLIDVELSEQG